MPHLIAPALLPGHTGPRVFLAGSIEMGRAEPWQTPLAQRLLAARPDALVLDPRREAWDASWAQRLDHPMFREQVEWEIAHLDSADLAVFYFQPGTQSPITLLELGRHTARPNAATSTLVCCPEGFWRQGNVEVVCALAGVPTPLSSMDALGDAAERWLAAWGRSEPGAARPGA